METVLKDIIEHSGFDLVVSSAQDESPQEECLNVDFSLVLFVLEHVREEDVGEDAVFGLEVLPLLVVLEGILELSHGD